ncbi:hypothetical protein ACVI1J_003154 [Bradyrhizobium diazoefficiens]
MAVEIGQQVDAAAPARDDRVGRAVEQHEHRLERRRLVLVAKADQLVDVDERELAVALDDARERLRGPGRGVEGDVEALGAEFAVLRGKEERRHARIDRAVEGEVDRDGGHGGLGRRDVACGQCRKRDRERQQATRNDRLEF